MVDADLGLANLDILLAVEPEFTILDALHGIQAPEKILVHTNKGFDLLPAGSGLAERTMLTQILSEGFASILSSIEDLYDIILFDAGAGVGDVVLFFANLADEILLVVTPEPTSLMDSYATIKILNQTYGRDEFLLIVNQASPGNFRQIGNSVAGHLQNVIARFIDSEGKSPCASISSGLFRWILPFPRRSDVVNCYRKRIPKLLPCISLTILPTALAHT